MRENSSKVFLEGHSRGGKTISNQKHIIVSFCGLDFAGKTTILNYAELGERGETEPTYGRSMCQLSLKWGAGVVNVQDLGGQTGFRKLWKQYLPFGNITIFVVDASNPGRFDEVKSEFEKILPQLKILLVLANKQDLESAVSKNRIIDLLGLKSLQIPWEIIETSGVSGLGIPDVFNWIFKHETGKEIIFASRLEVPSEHIHDGQFVCVLRNECEWNPPKSCFSCVYATCDNCTNYTPDCVEEHMKRLKLKRDLKKPNPR